MHACPECGQDCDCDGDDLYDEGFDAHCCCPCTAELDGDDWCEHCMGDGCPECAYTGDYEGEAESKEEEG